MKPALSTTVCFFVVLLYLVQKDTVKALKCYDSSRTETISGFSSSETHSSGTQTCGPGSSCMLAEAQVRISSSSQDIYINSKIGSCVPTAQCYKNNCDQFKTPFMGMTTEIRNCKSSCCDTDWCNDDMIENKMPLEIKIGPVKPLKCYVIKKTKSRFSASNYIGTKLCAPGSSCMLAVAQLKKSLGFEDEYIDATKGACVPTVQCEKNNCDQLKDITGTPQAGTTIEIRNCRSFCCNEDFCNNNDENKDDEIRNKIPVKRKPVNNPCLPNPCNNEGSCSNRDLSFDCKCEVGFKGSTCDEVDVRLVLPVGDLRRTIRLRCIAPQKTTHAIIWRLNGVHIDVSSSWAKIESDGRVLVINRPHYSLSGDYTCQVRYRGFEYTGKGTLKIPIRPSHVCGKASGMDVSESLNLPKVLGGKVVSAFTAPFMAMLYKKTDAANGGVGVAKGVFCGGSIVDTKHVVTAAHCFENVAGREIRVYVGRKDRQITVVERYQQWSDVDKIITHPGYDSETLNVDIALIVLKNEIYFSAAVKPICIAQTFHGDEDVKPKPYKDKTKPKYGRVFGWGVTEHGETARYLLEVKLPIVPRAECKKSYGQALISDYMFCAGGGKFKDACQGDSGGPFALWSYKKQTWYLGGIISWGKACGIQKQPGVYTKVGATLRHWIRVYVDI